MSTYRMTDKQIQILTTISDFKKATAEDIDLDKLLEHLPYRTTKQSMQFSLRALINKGILQKLDDKVVRRGRARRTYEITSFGKSMLRI